MFHDGSRMQLDLPYFHKGKKIAKIKKDSVQKRSNFAISNGLNERKIILNKKSVRKTIACDFLKFTSTMYNILQ